MNQKMRENELCWACEYVLTDVPDGGSPFECDPPMGECPLDQPENPWATLTRQDTMTMQDRQSALDY